MANNILPRGVIFDMDGVLVDSEEHICKAACLMFEELGLMVHPEDFIPFVGMGENRYIGGVAEKYNLAVDIETVKERTYDIYLEIIQDVLRPLPGVHEFIEKCKDTGKKVAVASSADNHTSSPLVTCIHGRHHNSRHNTSNHDGCLHGFNSFFCSFSCYVSIHNLLNSLFTLFDFLFAENDR